MSLSENSKITVNLAKLTGDSIELNGNEFVLTGKIAGNYEIIIPDGATVTLNKAKTNGIVCKGDCTIILSEGSLNTVKSLRSERPGIYVPEGKTLTIDGLGSLNVSGENAAGIGAARDTGCGNVVIKNGTIKAVGGQGGAGIGTGPVGVDSSRPCNGKSFLKSIAISGGSVTAKGCGPAAGIGTGWAYYKDCSTSIESITITDEVIEVTATRGKTPPGRCCIGVGGTNTPQGTSTVGSITIGGKVTESIEKSSWTYKPKK